MQQVEPGQVLPEHFSYSLCAGGVLINLVYTNWIVLVAAPTIIWLLVRVVLTIPSPTSSTEATDSTQINPILSTTSGYFMSSASPPTSSMESAASAKTNPTQSPTSDQDTSTATRFSLEISNLKVDNLPKTNYIRRGKFYAKISVGTSTKSTNYYTLPKSNKAVKTSPASAEAAQKDAVDWTEGIAEWKDSISFDICDPSAPLELKIYARRWFLGLFGLGYKTIRTATTNVKEFFSNGENSQDRTLQLTSSSAGVTMGDATFHIKKALPQKA